MISSVIDHTLWKKISSQGGIKGDTYNGAIGYNLIRLVPNIENWNANKINRQSVDEINKIVTGIMLNDFEYSMNSDWETMQTPFDSGLGGILGGIGTAAGGGELGAVYRSKKYWKKSGYLAISPDIRIIDIDGNGLPLEVARTLLRWCVADNIGVVGEFAQKIINAVENTTRNVSQKLAESAYKLAADTNPKGADSIGPQTVVGGIETIGRSVGNIMEGAEDFFALKQSPPPLKVEIGRVFSHPDMVLENVTFKFSREFTEKGPIYIDASLKLSSRKILSTINDIGLLDKVGNIDITSNTGKVASNRPSDTTTT